jgi:hypothetical protein
MHGDRQSARGCLARVCATARSRQARPARLLIGLVRSPLVQSLAACSLFVGLLILVPQPAAQATPATSESSEVYVATGGSSPISVWPAMAQAGPGEIVLFTGDTLGANSSSQTWVWSGAKWGRNTSSPTPPSRFASEIAYVPSLSAAVMVDGLNPLTYGPRSDAWEFAGGRWAEVRNASPPAGVAGAGFVYLGAISRLVLVDGAYHANKGPDSGRVWTASAQN